MVCSFEALVKTTGLQKVRASTNISSSLPLFVRSSYPFNESLPIGNELMIEKGQTAFKFIS